MNKVKITGIIPTFNNENLVENALKSLDFCDELIVIDSFSTDSTLDIVKKHTDNIYQREYINSANQKNWIIPKASNEWIFLLDSDEIVNDDLKNEIIREFEEGLKHDAYWIKRENFFMGRKLKHSGIQGDKVVRLFKKTAKYQTKNVHAEIETAGLNTKFLKYKLSHFTYTNMKATINKLNRYAEWQMKDFDSKTSSIGLYHLFFKPFYRFLKHFILGRGFLDGVPGFVFSVLQSYAVFMRYVLIWLHRKGLQ